MVRIFVYEKGGRGSLCGSLLHHATCVTLSNARHSVSRSWYTLGRLWHVRWPPMVEAFRSQPRSGQGYCFGAFCDVSSSVEPLHPYPPPVLLQVGREAHSYLTHVIDHYDQLGDKVVFVQSSAPGYGFLEGSESGHLMPGIDFYADYLSPTAPPLAIFTMAIQNVRLIGSRGCEVPANAPASPSTSHLHTLGTRSSRRHANGQRPPGVTRRGRAVGPA